MKRVIIICEGETEREFCQKVLAPHLAQHDIFIQAPLIKKSIGGIVRWSVLKKEIETYLLESNVIVTTLIDYYGLLKKYNFPKWDEGERIVDKNARMDFLEKGKTPFIRLMFRSVFEQNQEDPKYKMKDILNGRYDAAIIAWANEAKNCSTNLLVEFGTEVNGVWFSWNGYYYGGGTCDEYGDPNYPDGPEIFRDSYRHIIDLCNQQGCDNITWFFHFDVNDAPEEWWNNPIYYYPGDDYIDWIGVSTYGPFQRGDDYIEPKEIINKAYKKMQNVSTLKPYAILEFGVTEL